MIRGYAEAPGCRRAFLLGYFGEPFEPPCGSCDRCRALGDDRPAPRADAALPAAHPFKVNDRVNHARFGTGTVTGVEPDRVTIAFDGAGYHTIAASAADEGILVADPSSGAPSGR
jgi:ATP-dependent DNA helicase RecQ